MWVVAVLASGCMPDPGPPESRGRCPEDLPCVDVARVTPAWRASAGRAIVGVHVGDLNGDGLLDAAVDLRGEAAGQGRASVVFGPLGARAGLRLPDDEDAGYAGHAVLVGDLTGDGQADLVIGQDGGPDALDLQLAVVAGPLPASGAPVGLPPGGDLRTLRRGSLVTRVSFHTDPEAWLGPYTTWERSASLRFRAPPCQTERLTAGWLPDLDGDGAPELYVGAHRPDCWLWIVDGGLRGEIIVDEEADPVPWPGQVPRRMGDLDGDQQDDFEVGGAYVAGPLQRGATPPKALVASAVPLEPLLVDLDGDGRDDVRTAVEEARPRGDAPASTWGPIPARRWAYLTDVVQRGPLSASSAERARLHLVLDDDLEALHVPGEAGGPLLLAYRRGGSGVTVLPLGLPPARRPR